MRMIKTLSIGAVIGFLLLGSAAEAAFTPPTDWSPYLPANNQMQVQFVATGSVSGKVVDYYKVLGGSGQVIAVPHGTSPAQAAKTASFGCAWKKFYAAYALPPLLRSPRDLNSSIAAKTWFFQNIAPLY